MNESLGSLGVDDERLLGVGLLTRVVVADVFVVVVVVVAPLKISVL
jgi:hypothetical protein